MSKAEVTLILHAHTKENLEESMPNTALFTARNYETMKRANSSKCSYSRSVVMFFLIKELKRPL